VSDRLASAGHIANIRKIGSGTQTFNGPTDYTGNTVIESGGLVYTENSSMVFVPQANGVVNSVSGDLLTGTGTFSLDGSMIFDLTNLELDLTAGNSWVVLDPTNLASATLGDNFTVVTTDQAFTEVSL